MRFLGLKMDSGFLMIKNPTDFANLPYGKLAKSLEKSTFPDSFLQKNPDRSARVQCMNALHY